MAYVPILAPWSFDAILLAKGCEFMAVIFDPLLKQEIKIGGHNGKPNGSLLTSGASPDLRGRILDSKTRKKN